MDRVLHIEDLISRLGDLFTFQKRMKRNNELRRAKKPVRLHLGAQYEIDEVLKTSFDHLLNQKHELALACIVEEAAVFLQMVNTFTLTEIKAGFRPELPQIVLFTYLHEAQELYTRHAAAEAAVLKEHLLKTWLFDEEELKADHNLNLLKLYVEEAFKEKVIKLYDYRKGSGKLMQKQTFKIYPTIGISHSITEWFSFLDKQPQMEDPVVALFLKLDYVDLLYSSFIISIHHRDSIWIATDQISFDNPRNKASRRNPSRVVQDREECMDLPYQLVDQLDEIRAANQSLVSTKHQEVISVSKTAVVEKIKTISKSDFFTRENTACYLVAEQDIFPGKGVSWDSKSDEELTADTVVYRKGGKAVAVVDAKERRVVIYHTPEILFFDFKKISTQQKMYFLFLIERLFEEIDFNTSLETVMLAEQFVQQKLLSGATFDYTQNSGLEYFEAAHQKRAEEIIEALGVQERALVKKDYSVIEKSSDYEAGWLATPKSLEALSKWLVLEDEAKKIRQDLKALGQRRGRDFHTLRTALSARAVEIINIGLAQEPFTLAHYGAGGMFDTKGKKTAMDWIRVYPDGEPKKMFTGQESIRIGYEYAHRKKSTCHHCEKFKTGEAARMVFEITHYAQLMLLLGVEDRQELPIYFRNYKAHHHLPYRGNSILDNVHPYSLLKDPCSEDFVNRLWLKVFMCKPCFNRFQKCFKKPQ